MKKKTFWVYVLQSLKDGSLYIGNTTDLKRRLKQHNHGRSLYTKAYSPWKIVYYETIDSRSEAFKREQFLKSGTGRKIVKELICPVV